ncbi:MAG: methyltransferase domain-containing protein [Actinomycetota bacterium]
MASSAPIRPGERRDIADYYEQTWLDYRMIWLNPKNRAIHFGYWDDSVTNHSESLLNMNRVLARHIDLKPGQLVLDAGCGVGGTAMWLAEHHDVNVVGITIAPSQIVRAQRYTAERGLERRVRFGLQDYCRTAFADETFDAVYGLESINYATDKRDFIREAFRILKPGGSLVVQDGFRVERPFSKEEHDLQRSWLSGWMVPNLASREEFATWSAEAGFVDVTEEDCTTNVARSCRRLHHVTVACYPAAKLLHKLGVRSDIQHGNVRAARDQWRAMRRGLWGYGIVTGRKP